MIRLRAGRHARLGLILAAAALLVLTACSSGKGSGGFGSGGDGGTPHFSMASGGGGSAGEAPQPGSDPGATRPDRSTRSPVLSPSGSHAGAPGSRSIGPDRVRLVEAFWHAAQHNDYATALSLTSSDYSQREIRWAQAHHSPLAHFRGQRVVSMAIGEVSPESSRVPNNPVNVILTYADGTRNQGPFFFEWVGNAWQLGVVTDQLVGKS